jgi:hypothetical protein
MIERLRQRDQKLWVNLVTLISAVLLALAVFASLSLATQMANRNRTLTSFDDRRMLLLEQQNQVRAEIGAAEDNVDARARAAGFVPITQTQFLGAANGQR